MNSLNKMRKSLKIRRRDSQTLGADDDQKYD